MPTSVPVHLPAESLGTARGRVWANQVRSEILAILADASEKSHVDARLAVQYEKIEPALVYFVDEMIKNSGLAFAREWEDLAADRGESDGDEKFFDMMDDVLRDPSPMVQEQLEVFYTCLGLGFTGWYGGQPDHLRKRALELSARLRGVRDSDQAARIVPEAYEHVDTSNLIESPGASVAGIAIGVVGLIAVLFAANLYLYQTSFKNLDRALGSIAQSSRPAPLATPSVGTGGAPKGGMPTPLPTPSPASQALPGKDH